MSNRGLNDGCAGNGGSNANENDREKYKKKFTMPV
jgi:hypothetical protein